jgi:hypothetical protein
MIPPPYKNDYINLMYDSGVDELGFNLEFWSDEAWKEYIPGKHNFIGKNRYLKALDYSVKIFGPINTRSILVAGLEEMKYTIKGAIFLGKIGVMPIISPFRPLKGAVLENHVGFNTEKYLNIYSDVKNELDKIKMPIGPTCICCQNNTLSMPYGDLYERY